MRYVLELGPPKTEILSYALGRHHICLGRVKLNINAMSRLELGYFNGNSMLILIDPPARERQLGK